MKHTCHARGCNTAVKPELLMCFFHWKQVPKDLQRKVWATYRPGQCDDKSPSKEWFQAAGAAIGYVALKEGQKISRGEAQDLLDLGYAYLLPVHHEENNV